MTSISPHTIDFQALALNAGIDLQNFPTGTLTVRTPIDGTTLATIPEDSRSDAKKAIERSDRAFQQWRNVPAPRRGELVRLLGEKLRQNKEELGALVSLECGKIYAEGLGEVQEMIDICDFAVGQSRQLYGLTIASERPGHAMRETWHPMGVVGIISAFNFPVAVWAWNAALALICGNSVVWKPSEKTPLTALAVQQLMASAIEEFGPEAPDNLSQVLIGQADLGKELAENPDVAIVSATGSTTMGRSVGTTVAQRFGRSILELGGNNAMIVTPSADLELAKQAILFAAVGTAGQRCTTLRRLFIHQDIYDAVVTALANAYENLPIGNPLDPKTLVGPLIDQDAFNTMEETLEKAEAAGARITGGTRVAAEMGDDAYYVRPALVEVDNQQDFMMHETFAPLLYVVPFESLDEAIHLQNDVPQGLSSCIFSNDVREAELFLSALGSDCGIANVNIGPSGAEIGGAFGGEKETGGGRESGSDSWKGYMRRQTNTVNYSRDLPLAQGISFDTE